MISSILLAGLAITGVAADSCSRKFLKSTTEAYLASQRNGTVAGFLSRTSENLIYTENAKAVDISKSTLSHAITYDYSFSAHDPKQCAAFVEIIAATNPHPYVIHTRMLFNDSGVDGLPTAGLIESIVTDKGDWLFNATGTLNLVSPETWTPIPAEKRDTRVTIQAAGDAYFNRFGNTSVIVPWGPPCYRVEGGLVAKGTLHNDTGFCEMVWPSTIIVPYRRYIVDEELGVVDMFIGFPGLDRTQGQAPMPDSHLFRIEGGKIKYSHTASACVMDGCGLNGTFGG